MARREHVRIAMTDGISLSATLFLPETDDGPWPAIMEALPYRKDDAIAGYDGHYADLADHGYVAVRLDIRGTGLSADAFAWQLLEREQVAVLPCDGFGPSAVGHLRIALSAPDARLAEAGHRIVRFAHSLAEARQR